MLESLHIENIAVIRCADIDFSAGMSVLSGETGAGKSIIIDSIQLLLGGRGERELIRAGEDGAEVSAVFCDLSDKTRAALQEVGLDAEGDDLLLSRSLGADGKSRMKINGRSVSQAVLRRVGETLISILGQSESRALTAPSSHMKILDSYAGLEEQLDAYASLWSEVCRLRDKLDAMSEDEATRLRTVEMLRFQVAEIEAMKLKPGEEETLTERRNLVRNAERINRQSSLVYRALKGNERGSVAYLLDRSASVLRQLCDVLPEMGELAQTVEDCAIQLDDVAEQVFAVGNTEEGDPAALLDRLETRLNGIEKLKRKYGSTVGEVLAFRDDAKARLAALEDSDAIRADLEEALGRAQNRARKAAEELHAGRAQAAKTLAAQVQEALTFLDMPKVRFEIRVSEERELGARGMDTVAFLVSANAGEEPQPIDKIASGGELARIMLALKSVIADRDEIATVIFDEIDAGVSGKTARKVGIKLRAASKRTQTLCVTHSAQIASLAHHQYLVSKAEREGRTETAVSLLDEEGRVAEISRILGGIEITDAQRAAAREMLAERDRYE